MGLTPVEKASAQSVSTSKKTEKTPAPIIIIYGCDEKPAKQEFVTIPASVKSENSIIRPRYPQIGDTFYSDQAVTKQKNGKEEITVALNDKNKDGKIDGINIEKTKPYSDEDTIKYSSYTEKIDDDNCDGKIDYRYARKTVENEDERTEYEKTVNYNNFKYGKEFLNTVDESYNPYSPSSLSVHSIEDNEGKYLLRIFNESHPDGSDYTETWNAAYSPMFTTKGTRKEDPVSKWQEIRNQFNF